MTHARVSLAIGLCKDDWVGTPVALCALQYHRMDVVLQGSSIEQFILGVVAGASVPKWHLTHGARKGCMYEMHKLIGVSIFLMACCVYPASSLLPMLV